MGEEKLKWLRVRLTGKAQTAFMKRREAITVSALRHYRNVSLPTAGENCMSRNSTRERSAETKTGHLSETSDRAYPDLEDN